MRNTANVVTLGGCNFFSDFFFINSRGLLYLNFEEDNHFTLLYRLLL